MRLQLSEFVNSLHSLQQVIDGWPRKGVTDSRRGTIALNMHRVHPVVTLAFMLIIIIKSKHLNACPAHSHIHSLCSSVFTFRSLRPPRSTVCTLCSLHYLQSSLYAVCSLSFLQYVPSFFTLFALQSSLSAVFLLHSSLHSSLCSHQLHPRLPSFTSSLTSFYTVCPSCLFALQWFASSGACGTLHVVHWLWFVIIKRIFFKIHFRGIQIGACSAPQLPVLVHCWQLLPARVHSDFALCRRAAFWPNSLGPPFEKREEETSVLQLFLFFSFYFSFSMSALLSLTVFWGRFWQTRHALVSSISFAAHKSLPTDWLTDCPTERQRGRRGDRGRDSRSDLLCRILGVNYGTAVASCLSAFNWHFYFKIWQLALLCTRATAGGRALRRSKCQASAHICRPKMEPKWNGCSELPAAWQLATDFAFSIGSCREIAPNICHACHGIFNETEQVDMSFLSAPKCH